MEDMTNQPQKQEDLIINWKAVAVDRLLQQGISPKTTAIAITAIEKVVNYKIERAKAERDEEIREWARKNAQPTNSGFEDEQRRILLKDLINFLSTPQEPRHGGGRG